MITIAAVLVLGFLLFEGVIFTAHYLMHQRWTGPLWESHQLHHKRYNPKHPTTEMFQPVGWKSFRFRAVIFLAVTGLIFWVLPLFYAFILFGEIVLLAVATDFIHDATHTTEHKLNRYSWYRYLQRMHWIHHSNVKKNMGILTFFFDKIAGIYEK